MITLMYSLAHMLVDGICALAMIGRFSLSKSFVLYILLYNFCAFALQFPIGALLDLKIQEIKNKDLSEKEIYSNSFSPDSEKIKVLNMKQQVETLESHTAFCFAATGVILTILGVFISPLILGLGNALFHVGGGVGTIQEDFRNHRKGELLGFFVAPGALGLFVGRMIGQYGNTITVVVSFLFASLILLFLCRILKRQINLEVDTDNKIYSKHSFYINVEEGSQDANSTIKGLKIVKNRNNPSDLYGKYILIITCFFVVILRSCAGGVVSFDWKKDMITGLLATIALVCGKMLGGVSAARIGEKPTIIASLVFAAIGYLFSGHMIAGLLALVCFNMTMPITLQLLIDRFPRYAGTAFGLLTLALFLGFLPGYFDVKLPVTSPVIGALISLISLILLLIADYTNHTRKNVAS